MPGSADLCLISCDPLGCGVRSAGRLRRGHRGRPGRAYPALPVRSAASTSVDPAGSLPSPPRCSRPPPPRGRKPRPPRSPRDPADPFFDGSVLHDIFLTINSRDWASLKEHFLDNTYYPADFKWSGQTVAQHRHPLARHRQPQRRQAGPARRLRPLHHRPEVPRPEVVHPAQQHAGSERHARAPEHGCSSSAWGSPPSARRTPRLYINNAYVGLFTIVESLDKTFLTKNFNENDGHLYEYGFDNAAAVAVQLRLSGRRSGAVRAGAVQAGDAGIRSAGRSASSGCSGRPTWRATRCGARRSRSSST